MTIELYARRKKLLELYYADSLNRRTVDGLADQEDVRPVTIRKDWSNRAEWEPLIWAIEQYKEDAEQLLKFLQLAREQAIKLMRSADQDSVKVAAIGRLVEIICKEIELRQSLGHLPKMADKLDIHEKVEEIIIDATDDEATILSKATAILERKAKSRSIH